MLKGLLYKSKKKTGNKTVLFRDYNEGVVEIKALKENVGFLQRGEGQVYLIK